MYKQLLFSFFIVVTLNGCASQTTTTVSNPQKVQLDNSFIINSSMNEVWEAAIHGLSKDFFVIDHIEKDSKIITLSYLISNPENYIDCGKITVDTKGGQNSNTVVFDFAKGHQEFTMGNNGTPIPLPVVRTTKLTGKLM